MQQAEQQQGPVGIGLAAREAGLTVKAVRYYADTGLVPPAGVSGAGYRLFDAEGVERLRLVRSLRELGLDLDVIRRVLDRSATLPEVAAAHAAALEAHIRDLRVQRAALEAVAAGAGGERLHRLARCTEAGRERLLAEFRDAVFGGTVPELAAAAVSLTPQLPADPTEEQLDAWLELAELLADEGFRTVLRRLAELHGAQEAPGLHRDLFAAVRDAVAPAVAAGLDPEAAEAEPYRAALAALAPDPERIAAALDPRRRRYAELVAVVNGWTPPESGAAALTWAATAVRGDRVSGSPGPGRSVGRGRARG